ncbi:MAG: hypothetical protein ACREVW_04275 [Burkholderiales bacterium]
MTDLNIDNNPTTKTIGTPDMEGESLLDLVDYLGRKLAPAIAITSVVMRNFGGEFTAGERAPGADLFKSLEHASRLISDAVGKVQERDDEAAYPFVRPLHEAIALLNVLVTMNQSSPPLEGCMGEYDIAEYLYAVLACLEDAKTRLDGWDFRAAPPLVH